MKILVMGGRRLVGSSLVRHLLRNGHNVHIANRSGKRGEGGSKIPVIQFDRNDRESIKEKIGSNHWDVIYDMICYSPQNAYDILYNIDCKKYIMISSAVVYDWGRNIKEDEFSAETYSIYEGSIDELGRSYGFSQAYQLGKRGAEHIISTRLTGVEECIRARMPLVFGKNDHTGRLGGIVDAVMRGLELYADNLSSTYSVVSDENAGEYLSILAEKSVTGPINISDYVPVSTSGLINKIQKHSNKEIKYSSEGMASGYNGYYSCVLNLNKSDELGIPIRTSEWLDELIEYEVQKWRSNHG